MTNGIGYFAIHVPDALRAKEFYQAVLGWRYTDGDMIKGSSPVGQIAGGADKSRIDPYFVCDDAGETARRVRELGGQAPDPARSASGWSAECTDDQGGRFAIWQPADGYAPDGPPKGEDGDLMYFVLPAGDDERAKRFYGGLFGWEFTPGTHPRGWNIVNVEPQGGLFGAGSPGPVSVYFRVPNIDAAVEAVTEAGGTAGPVETNQAGWHAGCRDDQGTEFYLGSLRG
jgi:predicted enzyme related to lactoylglutathione lyase